MFRRCLAAALFSGACGATVTPVEKVVDLLESLKADVQQEGRDEAKVYDDFACFCRDTTKSKSDSILAGRDNIGSLSAEIAEKTASKQEKQSELAKRNADHEAMTKELADTRAQFAKERAEYEATAADLSKAIDSLRSAIQTMQGSKPASFLAVHEAVQSSLALAEALGLGSEKTRKAAATVLLQVDPSDPTYKYHSQGIIDTLNQLLEEFVEDKRVLDSDWVKAKSAFEGTIASFVDKLGENKIAMDQLEEDIEALKGEIAQARESLVSAEAVLKDDQLYMKDLTERCEVRANDWDQRSKLRADELGALTGALNILQSTVSEMDTAANKRALLLQRGSAGQPAAAVAVERSVSRHVPAPALVQLRAAARSLRGVAALSTSAKQHKAASLLAKEAKRLDSSVLFSVATSMSSDPFAKVKTLLQKLVERLLAEATAEATKKGFCDDELGKARKERDYRLQDSNKLDVEVQGLELNLIELQEEIQMLTGQIGQLQGDLKQAEDQRKDEHEENVDTTKKAKEGFEAVNEAIKILKVFYKQAAKATALVQASPVDEDTQGAGFEGAYRGKQENSKGIIGMLEVISSDFDRTDRMTTEAEQKAHEEFVVFDRISRADIAGKEMKKELNEEDAQTTKDTIAEKMDDLRTAQRILDSALRQVEALRPTCIDTGMSFQGRVAKREEEIIALKRANCILGDDGPDCQ